MELDSLPLAFLIHGVGVNGEFRVSLGNGEKEFTGGTPRRVNLDTEVRVIGTRHGEKLYETLVTREEMIRSIDCGNYYRIPCDSRDLNYDKYYTEGDHAISKMEDYHSHNTHRLDVEEMKQLLLKLNFIREDLGLQPKAKGKEIRSE